MNYSDYHPDWKDVIRPAILKRDQYKCRHCGVKHKSRVYVNSKRKYVECDDFIENWAKNNGRKVFTLYLHVAHVDQDKTNNDFGNLLALCPTCHSRFDAKYKKFKRNVKYAKEKDSKDYLLTSMESGEQVVYSEIRRFIFEITAHKLTTSQLDQLLLIVTNKQKDGIRK